jgi:hypothetical protein
MSSVLVPIHAFPLDGIWAHSQLPAGPGDEVVRGIPTERALADYEVSGTDWLILVEKFGLAPYLNNRG